MFALSVVTGFTGVYFFRLGDYTLLFGAYGLASNGHTGVYSFMLGGYGSMSAGMAGVFVVTFRYFVRSAGCFGVFGVLGRCRGDYPGRRSALVRAH